MRNGGVVRIAGAARRLVVALAVTAALQGCGTARNYLDPAGPTRTGRPPRSAAAPRDELRIVTFNIKFGRQADRAADLIARTASLHDPDLLLVEEMDLRAVRELSSALGLNYVYVPSAVHPKTHRDFGVAILSPWPLTEVRKIPLPHQSRLIKLRRAAAEATIDTPIGAVRAYAVHLETLAGASRRAQRDQANTVVADAEAWPGPVVIAGDFNGTAGADAIARAGFSWLTRHVGHTTRFFSIDHILVRGLCAAGDPPAAAGPDAHGISDHRPVWAVVRSCEKTRTNAASTAGHAGFAGFRKSK